MSEVVGIGYVDLLKNEYVITFCVTVIQQK